MSKKKKAQTKVIAFRVPKKYAKELKVLIEMCIERYSLIYSKRIPRLQADKIQ